MEDPRSKHTTQRESPGRAGPEGLHERTTPTCRPAFARSKPRSDGGDRRPEPVEGKMWASGALPETHRLDSQA